MHDPSNRFRRKVRDAVCPFLRTSARGLIKGYSNTPARGLSKFDRVVDAAKLVAGRDDAAQWIERLREAALKDEKGEALDGAIETIRSFT